ncbi:MAG: transporter permease [Bacillales bacterium]|jgi:oligopeptide transport system permease protein|nr:transporter permease [Bacillales bacterium]
MDKSQIEKNINLSPELFQPAQYDPSQVEVISRPSLTFWKDARRRLFQNRGATFGLVILTIILSFAILAPIFSPYKYSDQNLRHAKLPPKMPYIEKMGIMDGKDKDGFDWYETKKVDKYYYFGTDDLGRDQWTRIWTGTRISLLIGLIAATVDLMIGVLYGGISGYYGGRLDTIMQRLVEILMGIPYLIVVILFILVFEQPGVITISLAMVVTGWVSMSRVVRGQILKLKNQEYVLASRTLGASDSKLILKHLVPNVMGPIIVMTMFTIPNAIFAEAFLSFIGLGIKPPLASLGSLVSDGYKSIRTYPHLMMFPAVVISCLILSFNLVADGLRDALDPKMRR